MIPNPKKKVNVNAAAKPTARRRRRNRTRRNPAGVSPTTPLMQHIGWRQEALSKDSRLFAAAYIDPCHENHIVDVQGLPLPGSMWHTKYGRKYLVDLTIQPQDSRILYLTPFPECPLVIWDPKNRSLRGFADNSLDGTYLKNQKVYGYRPMGLGITVANRTAELQRGGSVVAGLTAPCVDKHAVPLDADGHVTYTRVIEQAPCTFDQVAAMRVKYAGDAKKGVYMPSRMTDPNFPFLYRNTEWEKAAYTPYSLVEGQLVAGDAIRNTLAFSMPRADDPTQSEVIYVSSDDNPVLGPNSNNAIAVTGTLGSGMMLGCVALAGFSAANSFQITIAHAYEFMVKPNSANDSNLLPPCDPDPWVVSAMFTFLAKQYAVAYPASYNFWGELWEGFKNIYKKIRPYIPKVIDILPPGASGIAKGVMGVVDSLV